ncbi:hypothetical protein EON82_02915 [bacterium]|nr:MAG: hypothetical protein EON82_02915 [bacterium]
MPRPSATFATLLGLSVFLSGCGGSTSSSGPKGKPGVFAIRPVALRTNGLGVDPKTGKVWASLPDGNGSVVDIDPTTGATGSPIEVGVNPGVLAVSADGSTMFVGLDGTSALRKVDLRTRTAGGTFPLRTASGSDLLASVIRFQPGSNTTIGVSTNVAPPFIGEATGPLIYDDGVPRPNALGLYTGRDFVWTSPSRIVTVFGYDWNEVVVDAQGASISRSVRNEPLRDTSLVVRHGGKLYGDDGTVSDENTLARIAALPIPGPFYGGTRSRPVIDVAADRVFFLVTTPEGVRLFGYRFSDLSLVNEIELPGLPGAGSEDRMTRPDLIRVGAHGLACRSKSTVYFLDNVPGL